MPVSLTIRLRGEEGQRHGSYMASLMQGVLMENVETDFAQSLHENRIHPYSQYVLASGNDIVWKVNAFSDEGISQIIDPLINNLKDTIYLSHRDETLEILEKSLTKTDYEELIEKYYFGSCGRNLSISFLTPISFKQNGKYCIFPTARLFFQSLMLRYDAGASSSQIYSEELVNEFEQYAEITDYRLRSVKYSLEGVKIPSFIGDCTFRIRGPQQLVNVAHMLARAGCYTGVGIKTGMGMGAITVNENRNHPGSQHKNEDSRIRKEEVMKESGSAI